MAIVKKLRRPCSRCGKLFTPTGKFCKLCKKCNVNSNTKSWLLKSTEEHLELIKKYKLEGYDNESRS